MNKAIFIDRDGVVNKSIVIDGKPHAPLNFSDFKILNGVEEALNNFKKQGFLTFIITNQPNIKLKNRTLNIVELELMHNYLLENFYVTKIYVCSHINEDNCRCRKPKIGNLLLASKEFNIDLSKSFFVGDRWQDVECAHNANIKTCFFIDYKYNEKRPVNKYFQVNSLLEVSNILGRKNF